MNYELKKSTYAPRTGVEALFLAAFDGVPQTGKRELRLSPDERDTLARLYPMAEFALMEPSGDKAWYTVTIPQRQNCK